MSYPDGCWLWPGLPSVVVGVWEVNQWMKELSLFVFQINKRNIKKSGSSTDQFPESLNDDWFSSPHLRNYDSLGLSWAPEKLYFLTHSLADGHPGSWIAELDDQLGFCSTTLLWIWINFGPNTLSWFSMSLCQKVLIMQLPSGDSGLGHFTQAITRPPWKLTKIRTDLAFRPKGHT